MKSEKFEKYINFFELHLYVDNFDKITYFLIKNNYLFVVLDKTILVCDEFESFYVFENFLNEVETIPAKVLVIKKHEILKRIFLEK